MSKRYVRICELVSRPARGKHPARQGRYGWSESTHWRKVASGQFPKPVTLAGVVCWPLDVIEQWEAEQLQRQHEPREHVVAAGKLSVQARREKREAAQSMLEAA